MTLQKKSIITFTDEQLVAQYKNSPDSQLFGEIYNRYYQKVYYTCLGVVKDRDTAYDMVQDVMIKVMDHLAKLENGVLLGLWINRIAKNHCIDYLKQRNKRSTMDINEMVELMDEITDMDFVLEEEQTFNKLEKAIAQLTAEEQELIQLKYAEGLSIQDLQERYETNKSAMKMRLARTRKKLAGLM